MVFSRSSRKLCHFLWVQLKVLWRINVVPETWNKAEGVYIPKEENSQGISMFQPISLLDVDGKIFIGIFAARMASFLLANDYIDTSVQKAGIPRSPGCVEHSAMIWHTIHSAKAEQEGLTCDLARSGQCLWVCTTHIDKVFTGILPCTRKAEIIPNAVYYDGFRMRFHNQKLYN